MKRIQRSRAKGWRMPEGAVYVGRPSQWGNPFAYRPSFAERMVSEFRHYARGRLLSEPHWLDPLRGHDLACWCPLDQPCHADVLMELANQ